MKKLGTLLVLCALVPLMGLTAPRQAEARQPYFKVFSEKYGENEKIAEAAKELKCGVCHGEGGKNKKVVSDYGKALAKALGEKNAKSSEKIGKAFGEIESQKPEGSDKSYGETLKAGALPKAAP